MDWIFTYIPLYVIIPVGVLIALLVLRVFLRALREGREVSFWPPKIGPRQPVLDSSTGHSSSQNEKAPAQNIRSAVFPPNTIALLVVESGLEPGRTFAITAGDRSITAGRVPPADIVLKDTALSRSHFRINISPKSSPQTNRRDYEFEICDLGSANGTMLNGYRIQRAELNSGALINAGGMAIRFIQVVF